MNVLIELPLIIKSSLSPDGVMRWKATASDTLPDNKGESTSLPLFQNWIERIEKNATVPFLPLPRMPFLGVSHYPDLQGKGEAGPSEKLYIDGKTFKASGSYFDKPLGKALYEAVKSDTRRDSIRISAAWWDLEHSHGSFIFKRKSATDECPMCRKGDLVTTYLDGQLDHFAATRVPINPRTILMERSMITRKDDAVSIVGEELATELEEESKLVGKADVLPQMVVKATAKKMIKDDEEEAEEESEEKVNPKKKKALVTLSEAFESALPGQTRLDLINTVKANIEQLPKTDQLLAYKAMFTELDNELSAIRESVTNLWLTEPKENNPTMANKFYQYVDAMEATLKSQASKEVKASDLQARLQELTMALKADLEGVSQPATTGTNDVAAIVRAAVQPLADQLGLIMARQQPQQVMPGLGNQVVYQVPIQRSVVATPQLQQQPVANQLPVSPITGQPSELTAQIRRNAGLA